MKNKIILNKKFKMRSHVEKSKKYELDKIFIKKIYNIQDKKQRIYKISKKNVVYDKQLTEQYFKYSNNNRNNYYSSYQSFRDYISSGYNYDFLVNEINNVKSILGFSRNIRDLINKRIDKEISYQSNSSISNPNKITELNEESNSNLGGNNSISNLNNSKTKRRASTVFQIDKENPYTKRVADFANKGNQVTNYQYKKKGDKNDFIEICKLLKIKEDELKGPQNQYQFRLFSVLSEEFDPFYLPVYENFVNVKYENQKTKLIKIYNQEKAFIECVTLIKSKLRAHLNKDKNKENTNGNKNPRDPSLKNNELGFKNFPQHKFELKIPYINAFYLGRIESYFKDIDNFMSMYKENTSLSSKRLEKDFFANLYKILTFNNIDCKKFLQYLYTHSYFFKYIYNIFTVQNKLTGMTIKNFAPSIKKHNEEEHFLNDSMKKLFFTDESKTKPTEEDKLIIKEKDDNLQKSITNIGNDDYLDSLVGNEFIYKINLCDENISDYINNKKIHHLRKLLSGNKNFNQNYLITLNGNENLLQIFNIKKYQKQNKKKKTNLKTSKYFLSILFDEKLIFYDLENELKNNIKIDKEKKKNDKFIFIGVKQSAEKYSHAYVFKLTKDIYKRFSNSITSKGGKIRKSELFGEGQGSEGKNSDSQLKLEDIMKDANDLDKDQQQDSSKKEILGFADSENDSNKNSIKRKNDKENSQEGIIKAKIRGNKKQLTFGVGAFSTKNDNLNESDEKEENEEESIQKDSSEEVSSATVEEKENKNEDEENEDEDEEEDEEKDDSEGEDEEDEDKNDKDEEENNKNDNENDDKDKDKDEKEKKEFESLKDSDEIDDDKSKKISEENSEVYLNKNNHNEEEINTDINKINEDKKNSIDSKVLSEKEEDKSNSTG